jgi:hypothetical protein
MKKKRVVGRESQCANCGKTFTVREEQEVLYCRESCEESHDLFSMEGEREYVINKREESICFN